MEKGSLALSLASEFHGGEECHAAKESLEQSWLAAVLLLTVLFSGLCN